jgi:hypothetical protein
MFLRLWTILQKTTTCNPAATFVLKSFKVVSIAQVNVATEYKQIHNRCFNQIPEEPQPPSLSFSVNCVGIFTFGLVDTPDVGIVGLYDLWVLNM